MARTAVPTAVFADAVLGRIADNVGFRLFGHLDHVGSSLRFRVPNVIAGKHTKEINKCP